MEINKIIKVVISRIIIYSCSYIFICPICGSPWCVLVKSLIRVQLFATPWTVVHQALSSMGFSRQEYWSGLPFPSPRDLPNPGIEPRSPALQAEPLTSMPPGKPWECIQLWKAVQLLTHYVTMECCDTLAKGNYYAEQLEMEALGLWK